MQLGPEGMDQYEQGGGGGGGGEGPFGGGGGGGGFSGGFRTGPGQQVDMEDIFQQFFGGKAYQPRRGPDLQVYAVITILVHTRTLQSLWVWTGRDAIALAARNSRAFAVGAFHGFRRIPHIALRDGVQLLSEQAGC